MAAEELAAGAVGLTTLAITAKDGHTICPPCQQQTQCLTLSMHKGVGLQYWLFQWMVNDNINESVDDSEDRGGVNSCVLVASLYRLGLLVTSIDEILKTE